MSKYKIGENDIRPWGSWKIIDMGKCFVVKQITVTPGGCLSLQRHKHRAEHWAVVQGVATVTLDGTIVTLEKDRHVYIPKKSWHRVENQSDQLLMFIEIQTGDILDENDIERKEDKYGRI